MEKDENSFSFAKLIIQKTHSCASPHFIMIALENGEEEKERERKKEIEEKEEMKRL